MDQRDFIKITSALYRVTEMFPDAEPLKYGLRDWGLKVLVGLVPYHFSNDTNMEREAAEASLEQVQVLRSLMEVARGQRWVHEVNMLLLDQEYSRVEEQLSDLVARAHNRVEAEEPIRGDIPELPKEREIPESRVEEDVYRAPDLPSRKREPVLMKPNTTYNLDSPIQETTNDASAPTERQGKILQMIRQHPRIQMKQIQEQLTDVTSRTLRRDLESLVQQGKIVRVGRGTGTFYQINFVDNS